MLLRKLLVCLSLCMWIGILGELKAQTNGLGTIKGVVVDSVESIGTATVFIEDMQSVNTLSEEDGTFILTNVKPGVYKLNISSLGYKTLVTASFEVKAGQEVDLGKVYLESEVIVVKAVVLKISAKRDTESAAIKETQESKEVVNVISAEQISKSQDRDAAAVMKRVPGVTLIQNRFVMVRGLNQRYNTVLLNGIVAPSSESETRAFSFDLVPSNMIEKITVYKSSSFDLQGDFAGAAVKLYTRNSLTRNVTQFSLTGGFRNGTTFNSRLKQESFGKDAFAMGAKDRQMPSAFPQNMDDLGYDYPQIIEKSKLFRNNWTTNEATALPDLRANLLIGRKFRLGSVKATSINNLSYSNTLQNNIIDRYQYINYDDFGYSDTLLYNNDLSYKNSVRIGLLSNWSFAFNRKNRIEFRNMFTNMASSEVVSRRGYNILKESETEFTSLRYNQNTIISSQLNGDHELSDKLSFKWVGGFSSINRQDPDWRRYTRIRNIGSDEPFVTIVNTGATDVDLARFFTNLDEKSMSFGADVDYKIKYVKDTSEMIIKAGFFYDNKSRDYYVRWMSYVGNLSQSTLTSPIDSIVSNNNINYPNGLVIDEGTLPSDKYTAINDVIAAYLGSYMRFSPRYAVSFGARIENGFQSIESKNDLGKDLVVDTIVTRVLPSFNMTYNFNKRALVRLAYGRTLNRPEFRELAPFNFYDFQLNSIKTGNPNLKTADIHSADLRFEKYPNRDEMFALGVFYKYFLNPIETRLIPSGDGFTFIYANAASANAAGAEIEVRKSLNELTSSKFIDNLSVLLNASLIFSEINLGSDISENQIQKRALQGQSPYVINTGLYYQNDENGWNVSLMYNVYGKRIFSVGDIITRNWYEMPINLLDLTVNKEVNDKLSFRVGISDLLNAKREVKEDGNYNNKLNDEGIDKLIYSFRNGQYLTLGLNYKF